MEVNTITHSIIGAAIKVHTTLGPGMLESAYEKCLAHEIRASGLQVECQITLPLIYEGVPINAGYRLDLRVADLVIVEIKAVDKLLPVHRAQLLSYLRASGLPVGLLINFNVVRLADGIKRLILT